MEWGILGKDIFGRDLLLVLSSATFNSIIFGVYLFIICMVFPISFAFGELYSKGTWIRTVTDSLSLTVESLPVFFWILVVVFSYGTASEVPIAIAFSVAVFPICHRALSGEFWRISSKNYVHAAESLGASKFHIMCKHILPNSIEVLSPILIHIFGAAIAVRGAIFALGFGNRQDLDLGILLFVGKENFITTPRILICAVFMYFLIYLYLYMLLKLLKSDKYSTLTLI